MARGNRDKGGQQGGNPVDWVTRAADNAIRHAGEGNLVTVSSGISPSGHVHLGNLREVLTVHFVADEIARRGVLVRHLHVWDDYDRFRKVPAGIDPSYAEHIGRPLSAVPDPTGEFPSWAERFKAPLLSALAEMGVEMEQISQTERYTSGYYRDQVLNAVARRDDIEAVMARYRTKAPPAGEDSAPAGMAFPFKPYCRQCGRDTTTATTYDDDTTVLDYTCSACGYVGSTDLSTDHEGKLVWKVDWPMRWALEKVNFEPAGDDHATPGSSFTVGKELVTDVFGYPMPTHFGYSFVGIAGMAKMSSSRGAVPTASDALRILEAPILRWLYVRRQPRQVFTIDFGPEVVRLYDEWDALARKAADPAKRDVAVLAFERASATAAAGTLPTSPVSVPFKLLSSVADVTAGSAELISHTIGDVGYPHDSVADLEPRLSKAMTWTSEFVPEDERTTVRAAPDSDRLASLTEDETLWLAQLLDRLPDSFDLESLTTLIYGVPKLTRGMGLDDPPTDEVKADQKQFFGLLYHLLVAAPRGPRLPTLFVALGPDRVRSLLGG
ncbi:MAG: lysine--tRNA ligase [Nocardioides sp.]|nr:lysine--tRNA ligase [Nocardioides sp.]